MKKLASIVLYLFLASYSFGQTGNEHKIVFQLATSDTITHKALMKQLNNILRIAQTSKLEIVCQGPGLDILMKEHSIVAAPIDELKKRGVEFLACEFSMKQRKVDKSQIIPSAGFVEAGILEIVSKQEKGWSYIKSGF